MDLNQNQRIVMDSGTPLEIMKRTNEKRRSSEASV